MVAYMWIKASKTNLYRIVAEYMILPKMKETQFKEVPEHKTHYLEWHTICGNTFRASISIIDAHPSLKIESIDKEKKRPCCSFIMNRLNLADLVERGMLKGIRHEHQLINLKPNGKLVGT
ncbi:MAG: hypothetical protein FWD05_12025 [Oscillospiraceae bacterium]|nr:hypothetical protein [Oscillospiraceae bacterium]